MPVRTGGKDAEEEGAEVVLATEVDLGALELALERALELALELALDSLLADELLASDLESAFEEGSLLLSWPMAGTTKASRRTAGFGICMSGYEVKRVYVMIRFNKICICRRLDIRSS